MVVKRSPKSPAVLTHLSDDGLPRMVDVGGKSATRRTAVARALVIFPADVADLLRASGLHSKKGAIVETAIVAGVMAAKRTHELIPFCHPVPLEDCQIRIVFVSACRLSIECEVAVTHKTGVEMEALTGASVAALTVYDMCKALSHDIVISNLRLIGKRGGKTDFGEV